nr:FAD-dependent oxidoreductase [Pseudomonas sp. SWRI179]
MTARYDFIVVGGGIAGVSVAYELAAHGSVCLLEQEQQLAYHTTGRSAAISMESYGNQQIRSLTCASRRFFENPPEGLAEHPLWAPRGALIVAQAARVEKLKARFSAVLGQVPTAELLDDKQVQELVPYLAEGTWSAGIYEPSAFDLDVHGIHGAYLSGLRARGGVVKRETEVLRGEYPTGIGACTSGTASSCKAPSWSTPPVPGPMSSPSAAACPRSVSDHCGAPC